MQDEDRWTETVMTACAALMVSMGLFATYILRPLRGAYLLQQRSLPRHKSERPQRLPQQSEGRDENEQSLQRRAVLAHGQGGIIGFPLRASFPYNTYRAKSSLLARSPNFSST